MDQLKGTVSNPQMVPNIINGLTVPIQPGTGFIDGSSTTGITYSLSNVLTINRDYLILTIIIAFVVGMLLFIMYFILLTKRFSNYLYEITDGIQTIASGDFSVPIRVRNDDEFAVIATSINKMADEIHSMMENERQMEQTKHELITSVAHDLRTPLTSIIGYLDLANHNTADEEKKQRYLQIAYDKSKRLERLIEDLFSYTKFSTGEVKLSKHKLNLVKLVEQVVEEFYPSFQDNQMEYQQDSNTKSCFIEGDGDLIARALANLLSNAMKYGKEGKIIRLVLIEREKEISIQVINYGSMIPAKDLPNVFDRFYRVEASRSLDTGGTGLGLAIVKKIILLHEGAIAARSSEESTVFEAILPKWIEEPKG